MGRRKMIEYCENLTGEQILEYGNSINSHPTKDVFATQILFCGAFDSNKKPLYNVFFYYWLADIYPTQPGTQ